MLRICSTSFSAIFALESDAEKSRPCESRDLYLTHYPILAAGLFIQVTEILHKKNNVCPQRAALIKLTIH